METKINKIIRSAGGIVIRKERSIWKVALLFKNQSWVFPKGRIKIGESEKNAALREIHEELGIPLNRMKIMMRLGKLYYIDHLSIDDYFPRPKVVTYFLVKTSYKKIRPLKIDNFQKTSWFNLEQALGKLTFLENKGMLFKAIKKIEKIERKYQKINTIVIPVGGEGKRLGLKSPKLLIGIFGQPFLKFLLDNLIKIKFKKIYLLTGYYQKEIERFVKKSYKNRGVKIIDGGKEGILPAVCKIKNLIKEPFIYHDGNIITHPYLLEKLRSPESLKQSMIKLALSPKDLAPTHLQVVLQGYNIKETVPRINHYQKNLKETGSIFYSMGIMVVDHRIFSIFPDFEKFRDWDLLIDHLFKTKLNTNIEFVDFLEYNDDWYCIHTKKDLQLINEKGRQFFRSFTIK